MGVLDTAACTDIRPAQNLGLALNRPAPQSDANLLQGRTSQCFQPIQKPKFGKERPFLPVCKGETRL